MERIYFVDGANVKSFSRIINQFMLLSILNNINFNSSQI